MPNEDPLFECVICGDKDIEIEESCGGCGDGPLCRNCKEYCEWNHTMAGQLDREEDIKLSQWKERNLG